ncbi:BON domain [Bordetella ansorpii]|uniref:BON domain n=1 Tax=Bordetella ansorpii TaxID=288768 RepID=A0A157P782_9BORD|nr:BON domain-containing protein [Bordetella ansorpii]SAI29318.1 BON domain [Bordetella ansorpii]
MKALLNLAAAVAAGAAAMYFLDPDTGRRRRAVARDKAMSNYHNAGRYARAQGRHLANHVRGAAAHIKGSPAPESDQQLEGRVRTRLGRLVSRPANIEVTVTDGSVYLGGRVPASEHAGLVDAIMAVDGVFEVLDRMRVVGLPDNVTELQTSMPHSLH